MMVTALNDRDATRSTGRNDRRRRTRCWYHSDMVVVGGATDERSRFMPRGTEMRPNVIGIRETHPTPKFVEGSLADLLPPSIFRLPRESAAFAVPGVLLFKIRNRHFRSCLMHVPKTARSSSLTSILIDVTTAKFHGTCLIKHRETRCSSGSATAPSPLKRLACECGCLWSR
jgi:hypothetical protein